MSAYICTPETYHDLIAWFTYGRTRSCFSGDSPGSQLLATLKHTDAQLLPDGVIGYHDTATAVAWADESERHMDPMEAMGRSLAGVLYRANASAVAGRYRHAIEDKWPYIVAMAPRVNPANVATWREVDGLEVLRQWDYQASETPADRPEAHESLRIAVSKFQLQLALYAIETGQRKSNMSGGWLNRISNATVDGRGPVSLSALGRK